MKGIVVFYSDISHLIYHSVLAWKRPYSCPLTPPGAKYARLCSTQYVRPSHLPALAVCACKSTWNVRWRTDRPPGHTAPPSVSLRKCCSVHFGYVPRGEREPFFQKLQAAICMEEGTGGYIRHPRVAVLWDSFML